MFVPWVGQEEVARMALVRPLLQTTEMVTNSLSQPSLARRGGGGNGHKDGSKILEAGASQLVYTTQHHPSPQHLGPQRWPKAFSSLRMLLSHCLSLGTTT
jgi:hypothetical protein